MAAVFSMQGMGQLVAAIVALVVTVAFKDAYHGAPNVQGCDYTCQIAADRSVGPTHFSGNPRLSGFASVVECRSTHIQQGPNLGFTWELTYWSQLWLSRREIPKLTQYPQWRIIVGFGALPACFALYYRITIPETPRYTFEVTRDVEKADADIRAYVESKPEGDVDAIKQARMKKIASPALNVPSASWHDAWSHFTQWRNTKMLIGTTLSWFFLVRGFGSFPDHAAQADGA